MSQQHSSEEVCSERVFNALKSHAEVTIQILDKILSSSNSVYSREYLTSGHLGSRVSLALTTLKLLEETEILSAADNTYSVNASQQYILSVKNQLHGYMYAKEEQDEPSFDLVMTTPKEPSILKKELSKLGADKSLIKWTTEAFEDLVRKAQTEIIIMTPFLDSAGAELLLKLVHAKNADVKMTVILRFLESRNSEVFNEIRGELLRADVRVVDYSLERERSRMLETFHAKVILADDNYCYLGSSNLDKYSIENSMELGALITGSSVKLLKKLMDIIISIGKDKTH